MSSLEDIVRRGDEKYAKGPTGEPAVVNYEDLEEHFSYASAKIRLEAAGKQKQGKGWFQVDGTDGNLIFTFHLQG